MDKKTRLLCPSMMCADFGCLAGETQELDHAGADIFHLDVMDGSFVRNYALGLEDVKCVRRSTKKPIDAHLMVTNPGDVADLFLDAGVNILYVHLETDPHIARTLAHIREKGGRAGLALNPGTALEAAACVLPLVDYLLLMTVNPGFAGQRYLPFVEEKLEKAIQWKAQYGYRLAVDGAVSPQMIARYAQKGVDAFVLGTSALFGKGDYSKTIAALRAI